MKFTSATLAVLVLSAVALFAQAGPNRLPSAVADAIAEGHVDVNCRSTVLLLVNAAFPHSDDRGHFDFTRGPQSIHRFTFVGAVKASEVLLDDAEDSEDDDDDGMTTREQDQ
ncbi:hypothetical protein BGZ83_007745 [Gryganskiella cystojenkinii]|nr:hypothetical protein BGZ83_007745 [Gryganskiella cystojenkinii]